MIVYCCTTCGCAVQESEAYWKNETVYCSVACTSDEVETFECQECGEHSENWWSCDHCGHDDLRSVG